MENLKRPPHEMLFSTGIPLHIVYVYFLYMRLSVCVAGWLFVVEHIVCMHRDESRLVEETRAIRSAAR